MRRTLIMVFYAAVAFGCSGGQQTTPATVQDTGRAAAVAEEELLIPKRSGGGADYKGDYTEERLVCGETVNTPELHMVRCADGGPGCQCIADGRWCFRPNQLTMKTENERWVFSSNAAIQCARNNDRACEWNALGAPDRFTVTLNNPTEIRATALTSSRSIGIRLCAYARYYP